MSKPWSHNLAYHPLLLAAVPKPCTQALDVGCGQGELALKLATRCQQVTAVDRHPEAFQKLAENPARPANLTLLAADVMDHPLPPASFDFITAVATVHHLPLQVGLKRLRDLLAPGGTLAIIGLYRLHSAADYAYAALALPASRIIHLRHSEQPVGAPFQAPETTLEEIRAAARTILPGAHVRRRLFFRYSLVWRKPL